jgi:NTP pyrophosphatase (non-canonical NTP hydrolase)
MEKTITELQKEIHKEAIAHGFYQNDNMLHDLLQTATSNEKTVEELDRLFVLKRLLLIHSEISEAMEALRLGDELSLTSELADATIRIFDIAEYINFSLYKAIIAKMKINKKREYLHGKLF